MLRQVHTHPFSPLLFLYLAIFNRPRTVGNLEAGNARIETSSNKGKEQPRLARSAGWNSHQINPQSQSSETPSLPFGRPSHHIRRLEHRPLKPVASRTGYRRVPRSYQHFNRAKKLLLCAALLACITAGSIVVATLFSPPLHAIWGPKRTPGLVTGNWPP